MIYQESKVQWMDVLEKNVFIDDISKLFSKYILRSDIDTNHVDRVIKFDPGSNVVKVTDWKGWSDITSVRCGVIMSPWFKLITETGKAITGSGDTMIPVYNPKITFRGFHGETKYDHTITDFTDVKVGDTVRVLHAFNSDGVMIHFDRISKIEEISSSVNDSKIPIVGYEIFTRSGFCNCNDFYVFAEDKNRNGNFH